MLLAHIAAKNSNSPSHEMYDTIEFDSFKPETIIIIFVVMHAFIRKQLFVHCYTERMCKTIQKVCLYTKQESIQFQQII